MIDKNARIYIAGHRGLVGSAIWRSLEARGHRNVVGRTHAELDLTRQADVEAFFAAERPEVVVLCAAKVGGIMANNTYRADFIYQNLAIQNNVIHASHVFKARRLLFLGSSCIYPRLAPQPLKEDSILTSELEPSNEPYAVAKIAGLKMCESYQRQYGSDFIAVMPTNIYGRNDNWDLDKSHVLPAMVRKCLLARLLSEGRIDLVSKDLKRTEGRELEEALGKYGISGSAVEFWGTGTPRREMLHGDDLGEACAHLIEMDDVSGLWKDPFHQFINIGIGVDHTIREMAELARKATGFKGEIAFDTSKPDGTPRKFMSSERMFSLGWRPRIDLETGMRLMAEEYASRLGLSL